VTSSQDSRRPDEEEDDVPDPLSGQVVVYAAMLGGTIAGQIGGVLLGALLGLGSIGVPLGISVALEALAGARVGARKLGPLTVRALGQISLKYSLGLLAISVPMVVWMAAAHRVEGQAPFWTPGALALAVVVLAVATLVRWGLMVVLAPGPRRAGRPGGRP
jgi:hypothetical protein